MCNSKEQNENLYLPDNINKYPGWINNKKHKPANQDIRCVLLIKDFDGDIYPADELYYWNGFSWWPEAGGGYYDDEGYSMNIEDDTVVAFLEIYPVESCI